ncbi:Uncharacterised protein [Mycobacteroides abscessus subsp. abscessus]|uniref:hypothetical protein n=1 Tax=Mycobacteroides abscessus TaxID=36809 RepID=UPI000925967E|nr:hypothetical protein [Mycobacteroides abscessus]MBN7419579.1 hypothetical protein [Mycobacteroides abscessus subsp. massiliense]MDM2160794.1 hypothetical protein [Mycobacteroides abscessus]MDM2171518.1 hypothetical protein [Mycobacteroides abscessus]MDM2178581.1 hypothetical protein [Mycobacteroides abscessus]MDM2207578.1 hypothetical protein [Mycobacteroides abscessus]
MIGPVAAAVHVIRAAKRGASTDEATACLEGLSQDELVSVLRLVFPLLAELYHTVAASQRAMQARTDRAFGELVQRLTEGDAQ